MIKKISFLMLIVLYAASGINHFVHQAFYYPMFPSYLPNPVLLNILAGIAEVIAAALLILPSTRKYGAYLIIATLIAFISVHVYMIQMGGCMSKDICIPTWAAWLRLFPLQFVLMWWAWSYRNYIFTTRPIVKK
jgi:uncharacterized membrane protein